MIQVVVGNNMKRQTVVVESDRTLRSVLEEYGIDYSRGVTTLAGAALGPGDLDKSFSDHGIAEKCFLYSVVKTDNA